MPNRSPDLVGQVFGRLAVVAEGPRRGRYRTARCRCTCGNETTVRKVDLRQGTTSSCGCLARELSVSRATRHGHTAAGKTSRAYGIWVSMKNRCENPKNRAFKKYGGRGITVCGHWQVFENFLADMGEPPDGRSLDRIDNDLGYFKTNCRWATAAEQTQNRRTSKLTRASADAIRVDARTSAVIAAHYGVSTDLVQAIKRGDRWKLGMH